MERRIFGIENEYGVTCTLRGQRRLSPDEVARYLFRRVVSWGRSSNVFLENGARLYLDVGSHPEYATPECDTVYDLVVHDKAGERILEGLLKAAETRLREEGISGEIYLVRNNPFATDHQYPRRAPRGRGEVPAPSRDRGRLEHERVGLLPQGREHGGAAAHDRGGRADPRHYA